MISDVDAKKSVAALRHSSVCVAHPVPVEARARIGLPTWRYVAVTHHVVDRIMPMQPGQHAIERQVLSILEWKLVAAFELNANGKIVAALAVPPLRNAGMPGTAGTGDELDQLAVATYQEMGRNPQTVYLPEIGMRLRIKAVGEQLDDLRTAELAGREEGYSDGKRLVPGRPPKACLDFICEE